MLEHNRGGVRERKIILKLPSRTPSLLQDCAPLPALTAESGLKRIRDNHSHDTRFDCLNIGSFCFTQRPIAVEGPVFIFEAEQGL
jgi:hypothetical protein